VDISEPIKNTWWWMCSASSRISVLLHLCAQQLPSNLVTTTYQLSHKCQWNTFINSEHVCRYRHRFLLGKPYFHLLSELSNTTTGSGSTSISLMMVRRLLDSQSDLYHVLRSLSFLSCGCDSDASQTCSKNRICTIWQMKCNKLVYWNWHRHGICQVLLHKILKNM